MGVIGRGKMAGIFSDESKFVSGMYIKHICDPGEDLKVTAKMLEEVSAVYILSEPDKRGGYVKMALEKGCHVMCESPVSLRSGETKELYRYAETKKLVLFEALKTAYFRGFPDWCFL